MRNYHPKPRPSKKAIAFNLAMMAPIEDTPEPEQDKEAAFDKLASLNQAMKEAEAIGDDDQWVQLFMEWLEVQSGL